MCVAVSIHHWMLKFGSEFCVLVVQGHECLNQLMLHATIIYLPPQACKNMLRSMHSLLYKVLGVCMATCNLCV
jgi:hypothetical protein